MGGELGLKPPFPVGAILRRGFPDDVVAQVYLLEGSQARIFRVFVAYADMKMWLAQYDGSDGFCENGLEDWQIFWGEEMGWGLVAAGYNGAAVLV